MASCLSPLQAIAEDWLVVDNGDSSTAVIAEFEILSLGNESVAVKDGKSNDPQVPKKGSLPLKSRLVETLIDAQVGVAEITETLSYHSANDCTVNFKFPVMPKTQILGVEANLAGTLIKTEVKRKAQANKEYTEAVSQGHSAVRMSQQSEQNIYQLSLGNLPADSTAVVKVTYLQVLRRLGRVVEYSHAATWVPPYYSWHDTGYKADDQPVQASKVTYTLGYKISVQKAGKIDSSAVSSATHALMAEPDSEEILLFSTNDEVAEASKDLQLEVELEEVEASNVQMQSVSDKNGQNTDICLATFNPQPKNIRKEFREVMLVIDCSGSMAGSAEKQAREAAQLLVRDLPVNEGISFNILLFGSSYRLMWPNYQPYNKNAEQAALTWLDHNCHANLGGTELLSAMQSIYSRPPSQGCERKILLLTDGGVYSGQDNQLQKLVTNNLSRRGQGKTFVFTLGIGHGVHRPLLNAVALKSHGVSQYVTESSQIAAKIGWLSKAIRAKDCYYEPHVISHGCLLSITPSLLPRVMWPGQPLVVLAAVKQAKSGAQLELVCKDADGTQVNFKLPLPTQPTSPGSAFKTLHAMSSISELMNKTSSMHVGPNGEPHSQQPSEEEVKEEVVRLACAEGLVTMYTSAVGVHVLDNPVNPNDTVKHEIPVQTAEGRTNSSYDYDEPMVSRGLCMHAQAAPTLRGSAAQFGGASSRRFGGYGVSKAYAPGSSGLFPGCPPPSAAQGPTVFGSSGTLNYGYGSGSRTKQSARLAGSPASAGLPLAQGRSTFGGPSAEEVCAMSDEAEWDDEDMQVGCSLYDDLDGEADSCPVPDDIVASAPKPKDESPVQALSTLRTTEGYWVSNAETLKLIFSKANGSGDSQKLFSAAKQGYEKLSANAWATILALAFLSKHAKKRQDVWQGMWDKATKWLQFQVANGKGGVDSVDRTVRAARSFV